MLHAGQEDSTNCRGKKRKEKMRPIGCKHVHTTNKHILRHVVGLVLENGLKLKLKYKPIRGKLGGGVIPSLFKEKNKFIPYL